MTQPATDLLVQRVSVFQTIRHTSPSETVPLAEVLQRIQRGTYRGTVERLREVLKTQGDKAYKQERDTSVVFMPCCAVHTRDKDVPWAAKLLEGTSLVHLDLDKVEDPERLKAELAHNPHIVCAFTSLSGGGVRLDVATSPWTDPASYKHAWAFVKAMIKQTYPAVHVNIDEGVKYPHALCFMSYDPHPVINAHAIPLDIPPTQQKKPRKRPALPTAEYGRIQSALDWIPNNDADYDTWLTLGMALHSTGESWARDLWDAWSQQSRKYEETKQNESWKSFDPHGDVQIGTLFYHASQAGWQPPRLTLTSNGTQPLPTYVTLPHDRARGPVDPAADLGTVSPCTHTANARRLERLYAPTLRYVLGEGWILWTGKFWRPDPTADGSLATGFVSRLARAIAEEAAALYSAAAQQPTDAERKALYALAEARGKWAAQSENATVVASGLKLAKHALLLEHSAINPNPWLLNCHNGTLDLQTGQLRPHDPADLITHLAPVTFDPTATCPTWEKFLLEVFARDQAMVEFMQRAFGWSLTGVLQDRALFFLYGEKGHNGKTTMVEAIRDLLGLAGEESFGYARKVDVATFMKSKNYDDNLRKTAQLTGARFVYSSEVDEEHRLNEQLIKDMTGGDTLEARRLYREAFNFKPTFKPWMYGNHKPEIRGTDDALWSRVKLIEFEVSFADRVDLTLPDQLRQELSGILNWALAGCLAWQQHGLQTPEKVKTATATYRKEQDTIGQFIQQRCQTGDEKMQYKASALYAAYRSWAEQSGHPDLGQNRFGRYLTAHRYPSDENVTGTGAYRKCIALNTPPARDDGDDEGAPSTLSPERVEATNASNDAAKPHSIASNSTLSTLYSRKSPIETPHEGLSGNKGRKGSNQDHSASYPLENTGDSASTLSQPKGSSPGTQGSSSGPPCFSCRGTVYWQNAAGMAICARCHPRVQEG